MGAGLLLLVGLVAADIWLWQSGGDSDAVSGTGKDSSGESALPGFPSPGVSSPSSGASVSDSVNMEIQREGGELESGLIVGDDITTTDSFRLETTGSDPGAAVGDSVTVGDSAVTQVQQGQAPPSGGGSNVVATVGDSADLVVRDASGNIKEQQEVK